MSLKIVVSGVVSNSRELQISQKLSRALAPTERHLSRRYIVRLLDDFLHTGPNGIHTCLVFELLGPSVSAILEHSGVNGRLPGRVAKRVCREMLFALDYLHEQNIAHGGQSHDDLCRMNLNSQRTTEP